MVIHSDYCQVRSECLTCIFRASCCSAHLSRAQVLAFIGSSVRDFELSAGDLLYAPCHRQDSTDHSRCYTSCACHGHRYRPSLVPLSGTSNYQQVIFYMHHATDRIVLTTAFVIPVVPVTGTGTGLRWFLCPGLRIISR